MTLRIDSVEQLPAALREQAKQQLGGAPAPKPRAAPTPIAPDADVVVCETCGHARKRRHKYRAQRTKIDNIWFDSKKEALRYLELVDLLKQGAIKRFHRQVPIDLPGGIVLVIDFLIVENDDALTYEDVKGIETPSFKLKLKLFEDCYNERIRII